MAHTWHPELYRRGEFGRDVDIRIFFSIEFHREASKRLLAWKLIPCIGEAKSLLIKIKRASGHCWVASSCKLCWANVIGFRA